MLEISGVSVTARHGVRLLDDVSLAVPFGGAIGLTGQSGAGKSTLIKCVMGILDRRCHMTGSVRVDDTPLESLPAKVRRARCGTTLGFIPQNPMTAFDPRTKISAQMIETYTLKLRMEKRAALALAAETLAAVNLSDVPRVLDSYPGQLSGGMLQRITLALILGLNPRYILADEPTSALDDDNRTILLSLLQKQLPKSGILLISHDVDALKALCGTVHVMEHGQITESGTMASLLERPVREWTVAFAQAYANRAEGGFAWQAC